LDYFLSFPVDSKLIEIVTEGGAGNTVSVVQRGIDLKNEAERNGIPFVHVYCVFDKDSFSLHRYDAAFSMVTSHNDVTAIWANECFELWYLLHFEYRNTSLGRGELIKILATNSRLGQKYIKSNKTVYLALLQKQSHAIENSKRLLYQANQQRQPHPWRVNPSTNVHEIVEQLNKLSEISDIHS
jgi:hypothetical protein